LNFLNLILQLLRTALAGLLLALLYIYKYALSPVLHMIAPGGGCRFTPTCSAYAIEAVKRHGPVRGGWLALKRIAKCHPWGSHGHDPVPNSCSCTPQADPQHPSLFTQSHKAKTARTEK
jgi:putative membrane protein insertion efficiency factor